MPSYQARIEAADIGAGAGILRWSTSAIALAAVASAGLIFVFADPIARALYPGFDSSTVGMTATAIRILSPIIVFSAIGNIFQSVLHSRRRFLLPALIPPLINVTIIASIATMATAYGIYAISLGYLAGNLLWIVILLPFTLLFYSGSAEVRGDEKRTMVRAFGFLAALIVVDQLSGIVQRAILSQFEAGLISAFTYGTRIAGLPIGILIGAVAIVLFPKLISELSEGQKEGRESLVQIGIIAVVGLIAPAAVFIVVNAELIILTIFGSTSFTAQALQNTTTVLQVYAAALPAQALILFMAKLFVAARKTQLLLFISIAAGAVQLILTYFLAMQMGWIGVPIATFLYAHVHMLLLMALARRFTQIDYRGLLASLAVTTVTLTICGAVYLVPTADSLTDAAVKTIVFVLAYFATLYLARERSILTMLTAKNAN